MVVRDITVRTRAWVEGIAYRLQSSTEQAARWFGSFRIARTYGLAAGSASARSRLLHWSLLCLAAFSLQAAKHPAIAQPPAADGEELRGAYYRYGAARDEVLVPVVCGTHQHLFMLDTGANASVFDSSLRGELGELLTTKAAATAHGTAMFQFFRAPRLSVLGRPALDIGEVACADLSRCRAVTGNQTDGVVGMDLLRHRIVRIDFDAADVAFLESVPADSGTPVPITLSSSFPMVGVALAGAGELSFLIDTGSSGFKAGMIKTRLMRRLTDSGNARLIGRILSESANGSRSADAASLQSVTIGGLTHRGLVFDEGDHNLLGLGYLSRYVVTFDFPGERMYLKPGAAFNEPSRVDLSGAHLLRPSGAATVHSVDRYSAAADAGLRAHDVLEVIDGQRAESLTMLQIRKILCLPGEHLLRVKRGERTLEIKLHLKEVPDPWAAAEISDRSRVAAPVRRAR